MTSAPTHSHPRPPTRARAPGAGTYLIVKNTAEAQYVCDYILKGGNRDEFLAKFKARL